MALSLGPDTFNPIQDMGSLVKISLPYDLRPMGINHTLSSKSVFERGMYLKIREIPAADCVFKINRVLVVYPDGSSEYKLKIAGLDTNNFIVTITINGELYENGTRLGEGVSGIVYSFTNTRTGEIICVKFQNLKDIPAQMMFIKEGIIHNILYESTKYDTHEDCQYVPEFKQIYRTRLKVTDAQTGVKNDEDFGIYIIGLCHGTYDKLIDDTMSDTSESIIQLARKLDRLYELYKFNHCDFHAQNCMYLRDTNGKPLFLLNDFGYSCIELDTDTGDKYKLDVKGFEPREERDLTHLVTYLQSRKEVYKNRGVMYDFGQKIVKQKLYDELETENYYAPWQAVYYWMEDPKNTNPSAIPINVLHRENGVSPHINGTGVCYPPKLPWPHVPGAAAAPLAPFPPDAVGIAGGVKIIARHAINLIRAEPVKGVAIVAGVAAAALYQFYEIYKMVVPGGGGFIKSVRNKKRHSTRRRFKKLTRAKSIKQTRRHGKSKKSAHRK